MKSAEGKVWNMPCFAFGFFDSKYIDCTKVTIKIKIIVLIYYTCTNIYSVIKYIKMGFNNKKEENIMKRWHKRIWAFVLVALMVCNVLVYEPVQTKAATTYTVTTEEEFKTALENAADGDVINVGNREEYCSFAIFEPITITKDLTINLYAFVDYYVQNSETLPEALVVIDSCDVTVSGHNQIATSSDAIYGYKLIDTTGDASLTIDSYGMLDEGICIVDDASNNYTSKVVINDGQYSIPTGKETAFVFSNGTANTLVPTENLIINGGSFADEISKYLGEDTMIIDNGEDSWCRYEVRSTYMSEQFKSLLTDGKIIVPSAEPKDDDWENYAYLMGFLCEHETEEMYFYPGYVSDGMFDISSYNSETDELIEVHRVEVEFEAELDSKAAEMAKGVVDNMPYKVSGTWTDENNIVHEDRYSPFLISDMEIVNMWVTGYDRDNITFHRHTVNYSGELKEYLENTNVEFRVTMIGAGMDTDLYNEACGEAVVLINDIMYAAAPYSVNAQVKHIIYVPDGTASDKDSLLSAAQTRINEYLGSDSKVELSYGGAFNTLTDRWYDDDEEYRAEMLYYLGLETAPEHYFVATAGDMQYKFLIIADSSKMISPTYKTVDASSNVSISSTSAEIPLDTSMRVSQLTSGEEYDKVIETLGVEEHVTYDLKLYSQSTASYVSQLESGEFEVRIPLTDELKGKDLVAYYVDENNEVTDYEVTLDEDGNYAVFATDHFSIYTLAEAVNTHEQHSGGTATCNSQAICSECGQAYGEKNASNHAGGTEIRDAKEATATENGYTGDTYCKGCGVKISSGEIIPATGTSEKTDSPKTGDNSNMVLWLAIMFIGGAGVIGATNCSKKKKVRE